MDDRRFDHLSRAFARSGSRGPTARPNPGAGHLSGYAGLEWQRVCLPEWDDLRSDVLHGHESMLR